MKGALLFSPQRDLDEQLWQPLASGNATPAEAFEAFDAACGKLRCWMVGLAEPGSQGDQSDRRSSKSVTETRMMGLQAPPPPVTAEEAPVTCDFFAVLILSNRGRRVMCWARLSQHISMELESQGLERVRVPVVLSHGTSSPGVSNLYGLMRLKPEVACGYRGHWKAVNGIEKSLDTECLKDIEEREIQICQLQIP